MGSVHAVAIRDVGSSGFNGEGRDNTNLWKTMVTYRRSNGEDEGGPVLEIGAEEDVGDVGHEQEDGEEGGA